MRKLKSIISICIIILILTISAVATMASLSSTVSVYWNVKETEAWAENVCTGPLGEDFYATAHIQSTSTGIFANASVDSNGTSSIIIATTARVPVSYPSPIPLVYYWGTHGFNN